MFRRYKFNSKLNPEQIEKKLQKGFIIDKSILSTTQKKRSLTAEAIIASKSDIVFLQKVENIDTLKNFLSSFIASSDYK